MAGIIDLIQNFNNNLIEPLNALQPEKRLKIEDIVAAQEDGTYTPEMYDKFLASRTPYEIARSAYGKSPVSVPSTENEDYVPFVDFLHELKTINRKNISPDFIYKTNLFGKPKYDKTAAGLFTDSYDKTSDKNLNLEELEREYGGFRDILSRIVDGDYSGPDRLDFADDLLFNDVLSPVGFNVLEKIRDYNQKYKLGSDYLPETYEQLLANQPPQGST